MFNVIKTADQNPFIDPAGYPEAARAARVIGASHVHRRARGLQHVYISRVGQEVLRNLEADPASSVYLVQERERARRGRHPPVANALRPAARVCVVA